MSGICGNLMRWEKNNLKINDITCETCNRVLTHDNIYLHDGTRPTVISAPIAKMSLWDHITYAKPGGWKNRKKKSIFVQLYVV